MEKIKKEPSGIYRWSVLIFVSLAMFGNYYVYDSISPLAVLLSKQLHFTDANIGLLNGIYSVPNIVMVLIGGIIIDRLGTRVSSVIFSALCLIGALLTAFSGGSLVFMAAGRLVFGLGAESLIVAVTTVLGKWFKGKQLSFAFGINLTIARLGTFAALNSPSWAQGLYSYWQKPLLLASVAGFVSLISVFIYYGLDVYARKNYSLAMEEKQDQIKISEMFHFTPSYWFIVLLCVTFYSGIFPFQTFAVKFFHETKGTTIEQGGFLSSILILSSMVLTPLFGLLSDYLGKRSLLMMLGSILLIPVYLVMAYTNVSLFIPMAIMGLSFSLIPAVMWPSVTYIVEPKKLGTAYGLMTLIQNVGLAGFNFLIGFVNDYTHGYSAGMWIFSSLGIFGFIFAFLLRRSELSAEGCGLDRGIRDRSLLND